MSNFSYIGPATTLDEALQRLRDHRGFLALDTETVNVKDKRIIGLGFAASAQEAWYFPAFEGESPQGHGVSESFDVAMEVLHNPWTKVWFNASFDLEVLEVLDPAIDSINWHDVSIMCRVQAMHNSLEMNVGEYLGMNHQTISDILPKGQNMLSLPMPLVANKCMKDCMATWLLWDMVQGDRWLEPDPVPFTWRAPVLGTEFDVTTAMMTAYKLDRKLIPLLRRIGTKGLALDYEFLRESYLHLTEEKTAYEEYCLREHGFNPGSNQQTGYVLADRLNFLPWTKTGKWKQFRVDGDALLSLQDPLAHLVLAYRTRADKLSDVIEPLLGKPKGETSKKKKTPFDKWVPLPRFTTHFRLDLATSRLASYDRQVQNITPELRKIFAADNGKFTWGDASQIEMRTTAFMSQDPKLLKAYADNESVHMLTMEQLYPGQPKFLCCRQVSCTCGKNDENPNYTDSKTFNFAMIYNASAHALSVQTRRPEALCFQLRAKWLGLYSRVAEWQRECEEDGMSRGWVPTLEGRRLRIPDVLQYGVENIDKGTEHAKTCCINYRVQGSASWPIKQAMLIMDEQGFDQRVQLHDEVVNDGDHPNEFPKDDFAYLMGGVYVPWEVKSGVKWA